MQGDRYAQVDPRSTDHVEDLPPEDFAEKKPDARHSAVLEFVEDRLELSIFFEPVEGDNVLDETVGAEPLSGSRNERVGCSEGRY
jgi:hypothetical protein